MIALSFSYPHHGKYSSYHRQLAYFGEDDYTVDASLPAIMYRRIFNLRGRSQFFWRKIKEKQAWKIANSNPGQWLHYLYPENGYFAGNCLKEGNTRTVFSCHLPQNNFEVLMRERPILKSAFRDAEALILMSPDDLNFYQSFAPRARIKFIPHGIDIHYFKPKQQLVPSSRPSKILTVGSMLRDHDTLARVINLSAVKKTGWEFHVLAPRPTLTELSSKLTHAGKELLRPLYGISNEELRKLYLDCDLLYLPLLAATANNALVESMASGLPMLLTDLPATRAYAGQCASYISGNDALESFDKISHIFGNPQELFNSSKNVRELATQTLSWEVIINEQKQFLNLC